MPNFPSPDAGSRRVIEQQGRPSAPRPPTGLRRFFRGPQHDAPTIMQHNVPKAQEAPAAPMINYRRGDLLSIGGVQYEVMGNDSGGRVDMKPVIKQQGIVSIGLFPNQLRERGAALMPRPQEQSVRVPQATRAPESVGKTQAYPFTKYEYVFHRGKRFIVRDGLDPKHIALSETLPEKPDDVQLIEHVTREELAREGNYPMPLNVRMATVRTPEEWDMAMAAFAGVQGRSEFKLSAQQRQAAADFFRTGKGDLNLTGEAGVRAAAIRVRNASLGR